MLDQMQPKFFKKYLHITQIQEMVDKRYFTPIKYHIRKYNDKGLLLNTSGTDYTLDSMESVFLENGTDRIIKKILEIKTINHFIIFMPSVEKAYELQEKIPQSSVLESGTDKNERKRIIDQFKAGIIKTIINVNILTIGFDYPALDGIIMARPTGSLALYYQMIGRLVRVLEGKKIAHVFDLTNNVKKFGKVEDLLIKKVNGKLNIYSKNRLLTGVDIFANKRVPKMIQGKYKDVPLNEIPKTYLKKWVKITRKNKYNTHLIDFINKNLI